MTRTTKIIVSILIGAFGIALIVGLALYFFSPSGNKTTPSRSFLFFPGGSALPNGGISTGGTTTPVTQPQNVELIQLTKDPVVGPALTADETKILYFKRAGGNLFRERIDGTNEERISALTIVGLTRAVWAPERNNAALTYLDGNAAKNIILTVSTSSAISFLPSTATSFRWAPSGILTYTNLTNTGLQVITTNTKTGSAKTVFTNPIPEWRLAWQDGGLFILTTPATYAEAGLSLAVTPGKPETNLLSIPGLEILPYAKDVYLASAADSQGKLATLKIVRTKTQTTTDVNAAAIAEKCVWAKNGNSIYCAVPRNAGANLPDDWFQGKILFRDDIVKINALTGLAEPIMTGSSFDATDLMVDANERYLFFVNKEDHTLWRLTLRK